MAISDLTQVEFIEGLFSLITLIITACIGLGIIYKFIKSENYKLISVGIFWGLMGSPWLASSITFIMYIFFNKGLPDVIYILLTQVLMPWGLLLWIHSYGILMQLKKRKTLLLIYCLIVVIYLVFFYSLLFSGVPELVALIGVLDGKLNVRFGIFTLIFAVFAFISILLTGGHFAFKTMKMEEKKLVWKGRFLLAAFIVYTIGALSDASVPTVYTYFTALFRALVVFSGILFYLAFFLPKWLDNFLIKS